MFTYFIFILVSFLYFICFFAFCRVKWLCVELKPSLPHTSSWRGVLLYTHIMKGKRGKAVLVTGRGVP
jgi:hypothetical protein